MEDLKKIRDFLDTGSGYGSGYGYGYGDGSGSGYGCGYGSGYGYGYGCGSGDGYGCGSGDGDGDGDGYGYGDGDGIKSISGDTIYLIDEVQTIIDKIRGNIAKGRILMKDLTTRPCYVIKQNGLFAHGETLRDARAALVEKLFDSMGEDERIEAFMAGHKLGKPYPNKDLYEWHHRLTGSCDMGRKTFMEDHGLTMEGETTVEEFIRLTRNAYGGATIRRMEEMYYEQKK